VQMHDVLARPLRALLEELKVDRIEESMLLVQGVLAAGMRMAAQGKDADDVAEITLRLLEQGIAR